MPTKYVKDESYDPIYKEVNYGFLFRSRIVPILLPALGIVLLVSQVILPLVSFKTQDEIPYVMSTSVLGLATGFTDFEYSELKYDPPQDKTGNNGEAEQIKNDKPETDSSTQDDSISPATDSKTNAKTTTPPALNKVLGTTTQIDSKYFYLTIPKLNIENAKVEINEPTLDPTEALGHYKNSALPGEPGNAFIYGHSVLPFFFNPKNYKTIFSTLGKLEAGDLFYVTYNGQELTYKVEGKRELKPSQVDPLAELKPKFLNESTMVLMTCSPPGTRINRLLIDAVLVE